MMYASIKYLIKTDFRYQITKLPTHRFSHIFLHCPYLFEKGPEKTKQKKTRFWFGLLCLTPISTILQLYRGAQFLFVGEIAEPGENHLPVPSH